MVNGWKVEWLVSEKCDKKSPRFVLHCHSELVSESRWDTETILDYSGCGRSNVRPAPYGFRFASPYRKSANSGWQNGAKVKSEDSWKVERLKGLLSKIFSLSPCGMLVRTGEERAEWDCMPNGWGSGWGGGLKVRSEAWSVRRVNSPSRKKIPFPWKA